MISKINNSNPSFNGIVPLRVFVDGQRVSDPKLVRSATRQLTARLIKPKEHYEMASLFAKYDPQYRRGDFLHSKKPSDFFRLVIDKYRGIFLATGEQTRRLNELGKNIGVERGMCHERRTDNSLDLMVAKRNYGDVLSTMLSSAKLRFCETHDRWSPVALNLNVKGKNLESITFTT